LTVGLVNARQVCKERITSEQSDDTGDSVDPTVVTSGGQRDDNKHVEIKITGLVESTSHLIFAYWF
jgi:hypothetical protein